MTRRCALVGWLLVGVAWVVMTGAAAAQINTDGSVGPARPLAGPNFMIGADLGKQMGGNLFHSFNTFNLKTGESATFTGPSNVTNIIGRVSGNQASSVDGRIASSVPGANLFLLNPNGWVFGANASLDVKGSFHVSTADNLRFADGTRFEAKAGNGSSFTAAPPAAFGFLNPKPAAITLRETALSTPAGRDLSIVGGSVQATGTRITVQQGRLHIAAAAGPGEVGVDPANPVNAPAATTEPIQLTSETALSVVSTGSGAAGIRIEGGDITLDGSEVSASNYGASAGGDIAVRAGTLALTSGSLTTSTFGAGKAGSIQVDATGPVTVSGGQSSQPTGALSAAFPGATGAAGDVSVNSGGTITLTNTGQISSYTIATGASAGSINVTGRGIVADSNGRSDLATGIFSESAGNADSGAITVAADTIMLRNGAEISSTTFGPGRAGAISVVGGTASTITIDGENYTAVPTGILAFSGLTGTAGPITVSVGTIDLARTGQISSSTFSGKTAGAVSVTARDIRADGAGRTDLDTGIFSDAKQGSTGDAGSVTVNADSVNLLHQGVISSSTFGSGRAGTVTVSGGPASDITIDGSGTSLGTGIFSIAERGSSGPAGQVTVDVGAIEMSHGAQISSSTLGSKSAGDVTLTANTILADGRNTTSGLFTGVLSDAAVENGDAGDVTVNTNSLTLLAGGQVSSSAIAGHGGSVIVQPRDRLPDIVVSGSGASIGAIAEGAQSAGIIQILADQLTVRDGGQVATEAATGGGGDIAIQTGRLVYLYNGSMTTSVGGGLGSGGNIAVQSPFVVLNHGIIQANAVGGNGGNIGITAGQYFASLDSIVQASSQRGINGTINIQSPDTNVTGSLVELSGRFLQLPVIQRQGCSGLIEAERNSSLVLGSPGGLPRNAEGPQPGRYFTVNGTPLSAESAPVASGGDPALGCSVYNKESILP
jgi:filamentous hemagglutinin family protein